MINDRVAYTWDELTKRVAMMNKDLKLVRECNAVYILSKRGHHILNVTRLLKPNETTRPQIDDEPRG